MHIDHINIKAPSLALEKEKQFFCDVLGMHEGFRPDFSDRGCWIYSGDKALVHLTENDSCKTAENQGNVDHIAFRSSDLGAFINRLDRLKTPYTTNYVDAIHTTQVFLVSPLGIKIEVSFANEKI